MTSGLKGILPLISSKQKNKRKTAICSETDRKEKAIINHLSVRKMKEVTKEWEKAV